MNKIKNISYEALYLFPFFGLFGYVNIGIALFLIFGTIVWIVNNNFLQAPKIQKTKVTLLLSALVYGIFSILIVGNLYALMIILLVLLADADMQPRRFSVVAVNVGAFSCLFLAEWYVALGKNNLTTFLAMWLCYNFLFFYQRRLVVLIFGIFFNLWIYRISESDALLVLTAVCFAFICIEVKYIFRFRYLIITLMLVASVFLWQAISSLEELSFIFKDPRVGLILEFYSSFPDILVFNHTPGRFLQLYHQFHAALLNIVHWGGFAGLILALIIIIRSYLVIFRFKGQYPFVVLILLSRGLTDSLILYTPEGLLFFSGLLSRTSKIEARSSNKITNLFHFQKKVGDQTNLASI